MIHYVFFIFNMVLCGKNDTLFFYIFMQVESTFIFSGWIKSLTCFYLDQFFQAVS